MILLDRQDEMCGSCRGLCSIPGEMESTVARFSSSCGLETRLTLKDFAQ